MAPLKHANKKMAKFTTSEMFQSCQVKDWTLELMQCTTTHKPDTWKFMQCSFLNTQTECSSRKYPYLYHGHRGGVEGGVNPWNLPGGEGDMNIFQEQNNGK